MIFLKIQSKKKNETFCVFKKITFCTVGKKQETYVYLKL